MKEIDEQIEQLKLEREIQTFIIDKFINEVCSVCQGSGYIMIIREGEDAMDGPRMHGCTACNNTGKPNG